MRIVLSDLGANCTVRQIAGGTTTEQRAVDGLVNVTPGVYVLSAASSVDPRSLPEYIGELRFDEFHPPPRDTVPLRVINESAEIQSTSRPVEITARVVDLRPPTAVRLALQAGGSGYFRWLPVRLVGGYAYRAEIPSDSLPDGRYEYGIVVSQGDSVTTFPAGLHARPRAPDLRGE